MSADRPLRIVASAALVLGLAGAALVLWPRGEDVPPLALTGPLPPERRPPMRPVDLPALDGGRLRTADLAGRLTLVNAWASWCAPCRAELPALDSLAAVLAGPDFAYVTVNDDVSEAAARAFAREIGVRAPVGLGGGRLRSRLGYWGLPTTWLLDAQGRVMYTWVGFGGAAQLDAIASLVAEERARAR